MKTERVKGFNDFTEEEAQKRAEIRKILVETFEKYGFQPAETPIIEYEEFVRGENEKDEAVSDIFKLKDKGKRNLALRYEFTFQLKRLMQNKKLPYKRYQIGEVFRDEPVSSNTKGVFLLGLAAKNLGIKNPMRFNNRKLMNEILEEQKIKNREGVMREIDKLEKIGEDSVRKNLKKYNAEKIVDIIKKPSSFFKKYESYAEIEELMKFCSLYDINVVFDPSLIRGLSYYSGSVFETNGIAGGSYVFNGIQSTGISFGLERISSLTKLENKKERFLIVSLNQDKESINLSQKLRAKNLSCTVYYGKPSKALEYANSYSISNVIFVGEKEVNSKRFKVKNMKTGKESSLKI